MTDDKKIRIRIRIDDTVKNTVQYFNEPLFFDDNSNVKIDIINDTNENIIPQIIGSKSGGNMNMLYGVLT